MRVVDLGGGQDDVGSSSFLEERDDLKQKEPQYLKVQHEKKEKNVTCLARAKGAVKFKRTTRSNSSTGY